MKRFVRNYSVGSLAIFIVAGVTMFTSYRGVVIKGIEQIAENSSAAFARMALHPIRAQLADYLDRADATVSGPNAAEMPEMLQAMIGELMRDSRVVRVKIYNRKGVVVFSTRREQIGHQQRDNPGFVGAMAGKVSVKLIYRDTFNTFDRDTEEDNLVQTYFPVRARPTGPPVGVFETYADVNALVVQAEHSEFKMLVGISLILATVYALLLLLLRFTHRRVEEQQRTIAEKNALLEQLSRDIIGRQEVERARLSTELHEGLAQSLTAVKVALESARGGAEVGQRDAIAAVMPDLQDAIGRARAIAEHLHPPGLTGLGLGPTVRARLRQFAAAHPAVKIEHQISVDEAEIPGALKIAIYRIVETALDAVGRSPGVTQARVSLSTDGREIALRVEQIPGVFAAAIQGEDGAADLAGRFDEFRERVMISKGNLSVTGSPTGAPILYATWRY